jgi:hypothetical protein
VYDVGVVVTVRPQRTGRMLQYELQELIWQAVQVRTHRHAAEAFSNLCGQNACNDMDRQSELAVHVSSTAHCRCCQRNMHPFNG